MTGRESVVQRDRQTLQDIFVSVTGETATTDRQDPETHKKVIDSTESDSSPGERQFGADPAANGLSDAIDDPGPE